MISVRILIALCSLFCLLLQTVYRSSAQGQAPEPGPRETPKALVNPGFEEGEVGQAPAGWTVSPHSQQSGYIAALTDEQSKSGRYCLVLKREAITPARAPGNLNQSIDAVAFRGKRVRLRAAVRAELTGFGAKAQLWLRVDRQKRNNRQAMGFFDNMADRPILAREWAYYEIIGDVEEDAEKLVLGLLSFGVGKVWMDDVSLEIVGAAEKRLEEAARPLTARGLENVTAFTQMGFRKSNWQIAPHAPFLKARKVFITDGRAISYAESCLGIVEHYKLAEIVGAPTAGTNGNVNPIQLPGGYTVYWTGMKVLKHDGSRHHGVGILPTVPVARTRAAIADGRDEFLERAIEVVKNAQQ